MRSLAMVLALSCAAVLLPAKSAAEVRGIFWDPAVSGEGWTFDSQQDIVAITWYNYENGNPSFRTIVAETTYAVVSDNGIKGIEQRLTGRLYRTQDGKTSDVGPFTGTFREFSGVTVGFVNAAGVQRSLVPFVYGYPNVVDVFRGLWTVGNQANAQLDGGMNYVGFDPVTYEFDDGTPFRQFVLADGRSGYLYFDTEYLVIAGTIFNPDTTQVVFALTISNTSAFGAGALFSGGGVRLSDNTLISASALTTSDKETVALLQVLGLLPPTQAKHSFEITPDKAVLRQMVQEVREHRLRSN